MNANDLSETALRVLHFLHDGTPRKAKEMCETLSIKRSTLRDALQRMELFGLVSIEEQPKHQFAYHLTSEGKQLLQRHLKVEKAKETGMSDRPLVKPLPSPDLVPWLRHLADSIHRMADTLAA